MKYSKILLPVLLTLTIISCKTETKNSAVDITYVSEIDSFKTEKNSSRKNGYLKLTGLFKLNDSISTFGRDASNTFQLDLEGLPPTIGSITKVDGTISFSTIKGVMIGTENDSIITSTPLDLDEYGSSIKLYHDRLSWQVITRSGMHFLRFWDEENPAIDAFNGLEWYESNPSMNFIGQFTYYEMEKMEVVKAEVDGSRNTTFVGKVTFVYQNITYDLDVGESGFTMVSDATTGETTYGGGRYMYLDLPEHNGEVRLDFNKLYNPPCAFSAFTTCLYPPRQNNLPFKVEAGEKITQVQ